MPPTMLSPLPCQSSTPMEIFTPLHSILELSDPPNSTMIPTTRNFLLFSKHSESGIIISKDLLFQSMSSPITRISNISQRQNFLLGAKLVGPNTSLPSILSSDSDQVN